NPVRLRHLVMSTSAGELIETRFSVEMLRASSPGRLLSMRSSASASTFAGSIPGIAARIRRRRPPASALRIGQEFGHRVPPTSMSATFSLPTRWGNRMAREARPGRARPAGWPGPFTAPAWWGGSIGQSLGSLYDRLHASVPYFRRIPWAPAHSCDRGPALRARDQRGRSSPRSRAQARWSWAGWAAEDRDRRRPDRERRAGWVHHRQPGHAGAGEQGPR